MKLDTHLLKLSLDEALSFYSVLAELVEMESMPLSFHMLIILISRRGYIVHTDYTAHSHSEAHLK